MIDAKRPHRSRGVTHPPALCVGEQGYRKCRAGARRRDKTCAHQV